MADTKISDLAAVTDLLDTDELVFARSGATKKIDAVDLRIPFELNYTQITSSASITSTNSAAPDVAITAGAVVLDGSTIVIVEFFTSSLCSPGGGTSRGIFVQLWDAVDGGAAASIGYIGQAYVGADTDVRLGCQVAQRMTPAAGSHVFSIRASVTAGTGTIEAGAGGSVTRFPAYIRVCRAAV